jgi:hypothetical protein
MSHLTHETLARLVDEAPTAAEAAHLGACAECRVVLEAMQEDVHALSLLPDIEPAPDAWPALEQRLDAEGLIRRRPLFSPARLSWAAAAVVVFMAGGVAGRMSADVLQPAPGARPVADAQSSSVGTQSPAVGTHPGGQAAMGAYAGGQPSPDLRPGGQAQVPAWADAQAGDTDPVLVQGEPAPAPGPARRAGSTRLASASYGSAALPRTVDDAAALLREAEELYLAALTRYAELASSAEPGDPIARLAALQSIVMTTQAALNQSPTDPVINGYHLTALAQRDATLKQVAATSSDRWH